jgi:hypothetical protein
LFSVLAYDALFAVPDAPSDSVYILCGVVIAMGLVAAIIILLAVFIRSGCLQ